MQEPVRHSPQGQWVCARPPPTPCLDISILACPPVRNPWLFRPFAPSCTLATVLDCLLQARLSASEDYCYDGKHDAYCRIQTTRAHPQISSTSSWRNPMPIIASTSICCPFSHRAGRLSKLFLRGLAVVGRRGWAGEGRIGRARRGDSLAVAGCRQGLSVSNGLKGQKKAFSCNKGFCANV